MPLEAPASSPEDEDEAARLAAVRRYEILDAPRDGTFDEIAELAAMVCGTPIASVTIVDADRVWFAAERGLDGVTEAGTEPGLCTSAFRADGPYVVADAALDPRTLNHPLVRGEFALRFYAAAPIVTTDGFRLGTVNVIDRKRRQVTENQTAVLTKLAALVAKQLDLRLAAILAVRAERELVAAECRATAVPADLTTRVRDVAIAHRQLPHPNHCQLGGARNPCPRPAELKLADSWGDSAWSCTEHVEEALLNVRSVFLANEDLGGLAAYVNRN
ncbi:GAF domain-containing protein [Micromonospora sp. NBC_01699]|uniref:GAF domain-containing protein n=1 Tax=Micromonospora sp. NBC_01699 TaxID=2975984 RepID=UPI002E2AF566|nr:GAF domain-containing protein [Micromonospora sp. NBC_01699]